MHGDFVPTADKFTHFIPAEFVLSANPVCDDRENTFPSPLFEFWSCHQQVIADIVVERERNKHRPGRMLWLDRSQFPKTFHGNTAFAGGCKYFLQPFGAHADFVGVCAYIVRKKHEHLITPGRAPDAAADIIDVGIVVRANADPAHDAVAGKLASREKGAVEFDYACFVRRRIVVLAGKSASGPETFKMKCKQRIGILIAPVVRIGEEFRIDADGCKRFFLRRNLPAYVHCAAVVFEKLRGIAVSERMASDGMPRFMQFLETGQRLGVQFSAREEGGLGAVFFKNRYGLLPVFPVGVVKRQAKYPGKQ